MGKRWVLCVTVDSIVAVGSVVAVVVSAVAVGKENTGESVMPTRRGRKDCFPLLCTTSLFVEKGSC